MMNTWSLMKASDLEVFSCTVTAHFSCFFTFNKYLHSIMTVLTHLVTLTILTHLITLTNSRSILWVNTLGQCSRLICAK